MKSFNFSLFIIISAFLLLSCGTESTPTYTLTTSVVGEGTITPTGGEYDEGEIVTLTSTPSQHWIFDNWSGDGTGSSSTVTITMDRDKSVVGNFQRRDYPLTITIEGEGTVGERIVSSPKTTEYSYETVVELTPNPSDGWKFVEWSGGVTSTDEVATVTVDGEVNVTVTFERIDYQLSINTRGEGTVAEELVQFKSTNYPHGTMIKLTANAADGWIFKSWENAFYTGQNPITIEVVNEIEITAVFVQCATEGCQEMNTSYLNRMPYMHKNFNEFYTGSYWDLPLEAVVLDYNQDGFLDLVHTNSDYDASFSGQEVRNTIQFFKGDAEGNLSIDHTLSGKFEGLVHGRKGIVGDFTNNGYPDIVFAGHGADKSPFPGEYPIILLNQDGQNFTEIRFTELVSFWHTITSGDINNNGNLDILLVDPFRKYGGAVILWNDGDGNFTIQENILPNELAGYTSELFDINKNGILDLILPFTPSQEGNEPMNESIIVHGNGEDFHGSYIRLPSVPGYSLAVDVNFFDINNNGDYEIIINRTSDGTLEETPDVYRGWYIQILELTGNEYTDATDKYITDNTNISEFWINWILISKKDDGSVWLHSNGVDHSEPRYEWELRNGKFVRVK